MSEATNSAAPAELNIRQAATYLDLGEMRLRALLREGRIPGAHKVTLPGSTVEAWRLTTAGLDEYKALRALGPVRRASGEPVLRGDGKLWKVRVPHNHYAAVKEFLAGLGIEMQSGNNYDPARSKAYREKRKSSGSAANGAVSSSPAPAAEEDPELTELLNA